MTEVNSKVVLLLLFAIVPGLGRAIGIGRSHVQDRILGSRMLAESDMGDSLDSLAKDNFKLILGNSENEDSGKSFFDFPEAKFVNKMTVLKEQQELQQFVKSQPSVIIKSTNRDGSGRGHRELNLNSIVLDKELASLVPDFTEELAELEPKPEKRRRLKVISEHNAVTSALKLKSQTGEPEVRQDCTEADQLSGKCQLLTGDTGKQDQEIGRSLKTFEKFDKEYSQNTRISNDKVRKLFDETVKAETERVEQDYQTFVAFISEKYIEKQTKLLRKGKRAFQKAVRKAERDKIKSITKGISSMVKKLNKYYQQKEKLYAVERKNQLRKELMEMQENNYAAWEKDQIQANDIINLKEDERLDRLKNEEKDKKRLDKELLETL